MRRSFSLLGALLTLGCATTAPPTRSPAATAPLHAPALGGGSKDVALQARSRPLLLVFWASWCHPCNREAPAIAALARAHGADLDVLGVNVDTETAPALAFQKRYALPYSSVRDPELQLSDRFGVQGTPALVLIGRDGQVRARAKRLADLEPALAEHTP